MIWSYFTTKQTTCFDKEGIHNEYIYIYKYIKKRRRKGLGKAGFLYSTNMGLFFVKPYPIIQRL
jgi:hypothetical protein